MRSEPRLLFGHDAQVAEWVHAQLESQGHGGFDENVRAIGIGSADTGKLYAGCVYSSLSKIRQPNGETHKLMQMSIASVSPMFATKGTIRALLHHPFETEGCVKVWATTIHTNEKAQRFLVKVGFVREGILRHQFGWKRHAAFFGLTKPEYQKLYGQ